MKKIRLDQVLVDRALYPSREQAQRAVMAGEVRIGEQVAQKPSVLIDPDALIATAGSPRFVGRGGVKLEGALDFFEIDVATKSRSTSAPLPAGLPIASCNAVRAKSMQSTLATANWPGKFVTTHA